MNVFREFKRTVGRNLVNIPGWRTNRKIVVIESDDWGSIRMPSEEVYRKSLEAGIKVDKCPYCRYDTLESAVDLSALFDALTDFKDKSGNHPVFTANCVVANPDFFKIKESGYREYHYELFPETLKNYYPNQDTFELWSQGMSQNIFLPQLHGREHLNVDRWLRYLQKGSQETIFAFENNYFGLSTTVVNENRSSYMAALDADFQQDIDGYKYLLREGLDIFEKLFGYRSESFIAPNYVWSSQVEKCLSDNGVKYLQGSLHQTQTKFENSVGIKHTLGEKNNHNQIYLTRNCHFEPSSFSIYSHALESCLKQINSAFLWHKPAIISTHRINYVGGLVEQNRIRNIELLKKLIKGIMDKWPSVEFLTSVELGNLISKNNESKYSR